MIFMKEKEKLIDITFHIEGNIISKMSNNVYEHGRNIPILLQAHYQEVYASLQMQTGTNY